MVGKADLPPDVQAVLSKIHAERKGRCFNPSDSHAIGDCHFSLPKFRQGNVFKEIDPPAGWRTDPMDYFVLLLILYKIGDGIAIAIKGSFFRETIAVECISNPPTAHG
jgi:hypothetical protein